jgi:serine/threonine protein kinase
MRIVSKERHPNLLQLKEVYEGENSIYLIMDIALGSTLNKFVRQKKFQLTPSEVQSIMK